MAFGWLKKLGSGIGKGIHVADQVTSNPMVGMIISGIPVISTAVGVIHAADKLFPEPDSNAQKRAAAVEALMAEHPGSTAEDMGKLVDAMVLLRKMGVQVVQ